MKHIFFPVLALFISGVINAQQKDLDYYLGQAKINSPLINRSRNDNKILDLDLKQIKSIISKPQVSLDVNILFAPIISRDNNSNRVELVSNGANNYIGYDLASTDGGQYQALVNINQPLFTNSRYKNYLSKADISRQSNENKIALTIHEIEQIVGYEYILCLKSKIQIENNLSLIKIVEEQLFTLNKLVENAIYKQTDFMLLQIEYQNYIAENEALISDYKKNIYDLNLICGINDTTKVELKEVNFKLKSDTPVSSGFLTSYKLDSLTVIAEQKIIEQKYKPQLSLFANAGLNAVYSPSLNRLGLSTGIAISWNIFDGNQREIEREKSSVNLQTIEFDKKYFVTQNDISRNNIQNQICSLSQRISLSEEQISKYDKLLNVYSKELEQGEISVMDYKNLLRDIASKKSENLLMKMEKQLLINSYNYWNY